MQTPPPLLTLTVAVFCLISNVCLCLALADGCLKVAHFVASGPFQDCSQKTLALPEFTCVHRVQSHALPE